MSGKLRQDCEIVAAHITVTTAAFQMLVRCLQENGALKQEQISEALILCMAMVDTKGAMRLNWRCCDLRWALMD